MGQVDYSTTPQELAEVFGAVGKVERVTIPGYDAWKPQGYAYLEFSDEAAQEKAVATLDGHEFKGRSLKVKTRTWQKDQRYALSWLAQ